MCVFVHEYRGWVFLLCRQDHFSYWCIAFDVSQRCCGQTPSASVAKCRHSCRLSVQSHNRGWEMQTSSQLHNSVRVTIKDLNKASEHKTDSRSIYLLNGKASKVWLTPLPAPCPCLPSSLCERKLSSQFLLFSFTSHHDQREEGNSRPTLQKPLHLYRQQVGWHCYYCT